MGLSFHQDKTKGDMLVILQPALGSMCLSCHHGGAVGAIQQKAELTPRLSRKEQVGTSFCWKVDSYTNKSGLFGRKGASSDSLVLLCTWLYC